MNKLAEQLKERDELMLTALKKAEKPKPKPKVEPKPEPKAEFKPKSEFKPKTKSVFSKKK